MKIEIKRKNYKQLVQFVYLGNLVINGYRNDDEFVKEYYTFAKNIYKQIIKQLPESETIFQFRDIVFEKSEDHLLCDLKDRIFDSVMEYYTAYNKSVFCEILAGKIADINYPIVNEDVSFTPDNFWAKNLYYKLLLENDDFITIIAPKIDDQIKSLKEKLLNRKLID